jgi:predicted nucleic acid-binding protein
MREFWVASGHHLTRRADHGGLVATPELIMAWLARPELMPPDDACVAERKLHASLLADPLRPVSKAEIAALEDPDARENWTFMMAFRDRLIAAPSLEAVYLTLARQGAGGLPPIFLSQLCHLILRNAVEGCDDPYTLRAAELFYRSQLATVHEGALLLADAEVLEAQQHARHDMHASPLTAMLQPQAFGEMDVMDDDNAWTYWSRSDAHAMAMNLGGNPKARAGLCGTIERWIAHLLGLTVRVETVPSIEDRDWRWFIGLDSEGTQIGNALWNGAVLDGESAKRIVALMRLHIDDVRLVDERVGTRPVYLIMAMGADKVVRLKPQNLLVGLPLAAAANVA